MRGELVVAPRVKNAKIPKAINDIVLRALAPDSTLRYQRASDLLDELLAARRPSAARATADKSGRRARPSRAGDNGSEESTAEIQSRLKARETPQPRLCWQCRKPLHARSARCPFCNEAQ